MEKRFRYPGRPQSPLDRSFYCFNTDVCVGIYGYTVLGAPHRPPNRKCPICPEIITHLTVGAITMELGHLSQPPLQGNDALPVINQRLIYDNDPIMLIDEDQYDHNPEVMRQTFAADTATRAAARAEAAALRHDALVVDELRHDLLVAAPILYVPPLVDVPELVDELRHDLLVAAPILYVPPLVDVPPVVAAPPGPTCEPSTNLGGKRDRDDSEGMLDAKRTRYGSDDDIDCFIQKLWVELNEVIADKDVQLNECFAVRQRCQACRQRCHA